jgi:uncharacterized membrane protein
MISLSLGDALWAATHLLKSAAGPFRQSLISRLGEDKYKGLISLVIVTSLVLMVVGWRSTLPSIVYSPPLWGRHATMLLMLLALVLFAASGMPSNIKRLLRHPQLTGVITWTVAHLVSNGDSRSLVLFGGIGLWALIEILLINRRDPAWQTAASQPASADIRVIVGAIVAYVLIYFAHPYLFGVSVM